MFVSSGLRYILASAASFGISFLGPILLHEGFAVSASLAVAICFGVTFFFNFFSTKYFVYRSSGSALREFPAYALANVAFRAGEYACFSFLYLIIGIRYFIANFIVIATSFVIKFVVYDLIVYGRRNRKNLQPEAPGNGG